ncbi:DUF6193 family natural product biosynthesis protein [Longispora sp. K20-0274]|uniref:DUF6193 family natural product biosynthesis protein n=1 Tax=Longispora sp. K20-0274 TaxID=3088255 RepID=UPI00399A0EEC
MRAVSASTDARAALDTASLGGDSHRADWCSPLRGPDGACRVIWWQDRSPHGPAIGVVDNPDDAVAPVLTHLPAGCGPAADGTADDLRLSTRSR